jgi:hypothetical protein
MFFSLLLVLFIVLFVAWVLGWLAFHVAGGLIHRLSVELDNATEGAHGLS